MSTKLSLAEDFPAVSEEQWMASVEKALKGADPEKILHNKSYNQFSYKARYSSDAAGPMGAIARHDNAWDIRQRVMKEDAALANKQILANLEGGATSVILGGHIRGVTSLSQDWLDRALEGVHLDMVTLAVPGGAAYVETSTLLMDYMNSRDTNQADMSVNLMADPLSVLAKMGKLPYDQVNLNASISYVAKLANTFEGKARAFQVTTMPYHCAGASEAQELAIALANGLFYLKAMEKAGIDPEKGASLIAFSLSVNAHFVLNIAKIRAMRLLWSKILKHCGIAENNMHIGAETSEQMMTSRDPWVNILRTTMAGFSAAVAGADALTIMPYTMALGGSSESADRIARNIHILLQEEASLGKVSDPSAGAYTLEAVTNDLAKEAWSLFQDIEAKGGALEVVLSGNFQEEVAAVWAKKQRDISARKMPITGVSEFANISENLPDVEEFDLAIMAPSLFREDIVNQEVKAVSLSENEIGLEAAKFISHSLDEDFEALRQMSDDMLVREGRRPKVFLANLGTIDKFIARSTFIKNFVEAGGIEAVQGAGANSLAELRKQAKDNKCAIAIICGTEGAYSDMLEEAIVVLRECHFKEIWLAGKMHDGNDLDGNIAMGNNVVGILKHFYEVFAKGDKR